MMLREKQDRLIAQLSKIRDPQARLAWVIEQAYHRPAMPIELRSDASRIEGCVVRLWIVPRFEEGRCYFLAESDALSLKALAGLMCDLYSGCYPEEVIAERPGFLDALGWANLLSENRRRTLGRVRESIQTFAHGCLAERMNAELVPNRPEFCEYQIGAS